MKSLDTYDVVPPAMRNYISHYGFHFSKNAVEYAVSLMFHTDPSNGKKKKVTLMEKEQVDKMLTAQNIQLEHNKLYDYVFVANMAKSDYSKSLPDDTKVAWYIKETIDDPDASDETTFRRWLATMVGNGEPVDWDAML